MSSTEPLIKPFVNAEENHLRPASIEEPCSLPDVTFGPSNSALRSISRESQPLLSRMDHEFLCQCNTFRDDPQFSQIIREVELAIANGIAPERISQGSSGSYFVRNEDMVSSVG